MAGSEAGCFQVFVGDTLQGEGDSVAIHTEGVHPLTLRYLGEGSAELMAIEFEV